MNIKSAIKFYVYKKWISFLEIVRNQIIMHEMNENNNVNNTNMSNRVITLRQRLQNYLFGNIYELKGFGELEKFLSRFHVLICPTFYDYINHVNHPNRKTIAYLLNALNWAMVLRFAILAYINKPWVWALLGDSFYMWGDSRYVSAMFCSLATAIALAASSYTYFELNHIFFAIGFLNNLRELKSHNKLNPNYYSKFCLKVKFCIKILYPSVLFCSLIPSLVHTTTSVICYLNHDINHSIISLFISNIILQIWLVHAVAMGFGGSFIMQYFIVSHLKYRFRQINDEMRLCIVLKNYNSILKVISKHQIITIDVNHTNKFMRFVIGFCYFFVTPGMDILLTLCLKTRVHYLVRFVYFSAGFGLFFVQIGINYMCSSLAATAHKSKIVLYSRIQHMKVSHISKLKFMAFIEKLSANSIGFYCFDLFFCNNYEFYQYLTFIFYTYFLVRQFISNV